ncbi:MAG: glycoside hydrolase family 16 protein [Chitinophagaceae bacterium]|uniref:glycoside hydrolase family 16 protein n=1 Tax=unclassified Paraflavitalea TaxID=2798305 RepID=UPI003D335AF5|nr:glycoside hydrolase family 16 protein [Chitinophagaceae bacterium]
MKRLLAPVFLTLLLTQSGPGQAQEKSWKLIWADEFNYTGLPDSTKWNYDVGGNGWGNNEKQYYTKARLDNASVDKGLLTITCIKEKFEGMEYSSARLVTKGKGDWQYGKIRVRAKLPKGLGTWPAIWMLGSTTPLKWPDDGEIDIMEHVGYDQGRVHASIHCKTYNHIIGTQKTANVVLPDCSEAFHVYGVEWNKDEVIMTIDENVYFRFKNDHTDYAAWPFDNKMYLILNIAAGGNWGGAKGVDEKIWPQKMEIDYVRVYQ